MIDGTRIKARCERDRTEFVALVHTGFTPAGETMWVNCPTCGRGYYSQDGGKTYVSDRPLTLL